MEPMQNDLIIRFLRASAYQPKNFFCVHLPIRVILILKRKVIDNTAEKINFQILR